MNIEIDELPNNEAVTKLTEAFTGSGLTFTDKSSALAAFKETHIITVGDDGGLETVYSGVRQPLRLALAAWGRTGEGEAHTDRRSLPKDEKNPGGIRCKTDLKTNKERAEYIARFGGAAYEKLPSNYQPVEETKFRDQYYRLSLSQKTELARQGVTANDFPIRPTGQIAGSFINHDLIAKEKKIRPNQR